MVLETVTCRQISTISLTEYGISEFSKHSLVGVMDSGFRMDKVASGWHTKIPLGQGGQVFAFGTVWNDLMS